MTDTDIDRISDLPDGVLEHIISFLGTKKAVQTSVISKRWKNLWTFSSCVNLDQDHFSCFKDFICFGDMVLCRLETSYLHTFSMNFFRYDRFGSEPDTSFCRRWINSAIKFKPRVCQMRVSIPDCDVIASIFTCESIEDMFLDICVSGCTLHWSNIIPTTVNLPHITKLCVSFAYLNEETTARLLKGCPVLENLQLRYCCGVLSPIFRQKLICLSLINCTSNHEKDLLILPKIVDLPCIRRLHITNLYVDEESFTWLLAGCPLLENLSLSCYGTISNPFRNKINCLNIWGGTIKTQWNNIWWRIDGAFVKFNLSGDAKISIACTLEPLNMEFIWNPPIGTAVDFKNNFDPSIIFSSAKCLKLCFPDTKVDWIKELQKIGPFNNLKSLSIRLADWCMDPNEIDPVVWFLRKSPNIEELTLYNPKREIEHSGRGKPKQLALCHESDYYISLSKELIEFKDLKQIEIKVCENLFGARDVKEALIRQIEDLVTMKVVLSVTPRRIL